uniref:Uncharacterized protein n=1 Tax=Panagrolaimus sp. JU765 TaxID=591449 RepID=A0AC34Q8M2_9BILA
MPMLACPDEVDTFVGVLDNVTVSFGVLPEQIETVLLETLNKERNFQLNRGPKDGSPLQVIERRLRIGIHNGFTFVEEPMVFYLSSKDEMDSGRHSLRRRSRSLSRISNFIRSEYQTFQVRNNIRLTKLLADDESAIVFAVDYLIGATNSLGNIIESNLIM